MGRILTLVITKLPILLWKFSRLIYFECGLNVICEGYASKNAHLLTFYFHVFMRFFLEVYVGPHEPWPASAGEATISS